MALFSTSQGNDVPHCHIPDFPCEEKNFTAAEVQAARDWMALHFPKTVEIRVPSLRYNCHGYAYADAHGWFDEPDLFIADDFSEVPLASPQKDDVVLYMNGGVLMHSAVIKSVSRGSIKKLRSKWGGGPAVTHDLADVPAVYGNPVHLLRRNAAS